MLQKNTQKTPGGLLLLALLCCILFAACSGASSSLPAGASASAPSVLSNRIPGATGDGRDGGTPSAATPESLAPDVASAEAGAETLTFTGTIVDEGMGKLVVEAPDGVTVAFDITAADLSALEDSRPGNTVVVYYTGTLKGTDTSGITVLRVETAR